VKVYLLAFIFLFLAKPGISQGHSFYLHRNDKVVFYGDSITDQRLYTTIVETYVATRYPQFNVKFINSGVGADTASGGFGGPVDTRLQRDVIAYKPTVVTIMLGLNDGGYKAETQDVDQKYFDGMRHIVNTLRSSLPGVRITVMEESLYDDYTRPSALPVTDINLDYNQLVVSYGDWLANYAQQAGLHFADLHADFVHTLQKAMELDPTLATQIFPDHLHPSFAGHMILAKELLQSWGARPLVSEVVIDASREQPHLKVAKDATVSDLIDNGGSIRWTELDNALPLPLSQWQTKWIDGPIVALIIKSSDIAQTLNEEPLEITGLKRGVYALKIDHEKVGSFNSQELAAGINLAMMNTPMSAQALEVYNAVVQHSDLHYAEWRTVQLPLTEYNLSQTEAAMSSLNVLEDTVVNKEHNLAQPKSHTFELIPIS
jgi:lysophospholipase L1-like esterase